MNSRRLSQKAAWQCEYALDDRCRCRCGGKLHGAARVPNRERLAKLPANDPHYVHAKKEKFFREVISIGEPELSQPFQFRDRFFRSLLLECGHKLTIKA